MRIDGDLYQAAPTQRFYSIFHRSDLIESETRESLSPLRRYELGRTLTHRWPWYRRALNFTEGITRFIEAWLGSIQVVSGGTPISPLLLAFISINSHNQNSLWGFEVDETAYSLRDRKFSIKNRLPNEIPILSVRAIRRSSINSHLNTLRWTFTTMTIGTMWARTRTQDPQ